MPFLVKGVISLHYATINSEILKQTSYQKFVDVPLETQLKPLTVEIYNYNTSNNPLAKCYNAKYLKSIFETQERVKKEPTIRDSLRQKVTPLLH